MLWPKKNSYKEFDNEKRFLRLENSPLATSTVNPLLSPLSKEPSFFRGRKLISPLLF